MTKPRRNNRRVARRSLRPALLLLLLTASALALVAGGSAFSGAARKAEAARSQDDSAADAQGLSPAVAQQIQALMEEKESRTPAQQKIDSQLVYALKMERHEPIAPGVDTLAVNVGASDEGRVVVDIAAVVSDALLNSLRANGASVLFAAPDYHTVRAEVSLDRLELIAASSDVRFIGLPPQAATARSAEDTPVFPSPFFRRPGLDSRAARAARIREKVSQAIAKFQEEDKPLDNGAGANVGARQSEGDVTHRANIARARYGVDGTGVKVGVISDGVITLSFAQATGDLPPDVTILPGQAGTGDEGTAMLEIVHDIAPGAKLYFATAFGSITNFADNVRKLRAAGCDIIVDDVFYTNEVVFHDGQAPGVVSTTNAGVVLQAVNDVTASGALYFSSAGNAGNKNDNTSGVWEGDFNDGGASSIPGLTAGTVHDFDPATSGVQFDQVLSATTLQFVLWWADPLGASTNDYDLFAVNSAQTAVVGSSTNVQNGTQDPYEAISPPAAGTRIVIVKRTGAAQRFLHLDTNRGRLAINTPGATHGHSHSALAYSVAATPVFPPYPNAYDSTQQIETFSSDGPRKLFFAADNTPFTPANFISTGGIIRQKPDITASDGGVVSGAGGFSNPFFGTSAAAPHAGAITALLKQAKPAFTQAQIRAALNASAIDIEAPGVDRDSGVGIIMADTMLAAAGVPTTELEVANVTVTETAGNGNGAVEPGEKGSLTVQLRNTTGATATNISATLTTSTPGVTIIPPGTSTYPDIPAGGTANNTTPFQFIIGSSAGCPSTIDFTLTVNFSGGTSSPRVLHFSVNVGRSLTINTTLDTVAPTSGDNYTATTGQQTGRLVRTGATTGCGINKPNPGVNAADANVAHRYDAYTFQNPTSSPICVTVTLTTSAANANNLQSVAYAPTFNPAVPNENYLGDIAGNNGAAQRFYQFTVPANTTFVVVVNEVTGGAGVGTPYTLQIDGLPCAAAGAPLVALQFTQATYQVTEDTTAVNVTVTRTGDTNFPVTFSYATADGTATQRTDYTKAIGTATIPAGQDSVIIPILVNEDSYVEGTETFTVVLSNPQGIEVGFGATSVATIQINDDAVEPTTNVIDDSNLFVRQHYHDFLNREGDPSGVAFWTNNIESCGANAGCREAKRIDTSAAFFLSIEFQESGFFSYLFYQEAYGRRISGTVPMTFDEFIRDSRRIGQGVIIGQPDALTRLESNKQAFALEFVARPEFLAVYPRSMNPAAFVDAINANTGGSLTTNQRNALVAQLAADNTDAGRASVLRQVADNTAFRQAETNRAFVLMEYFGYLRRNPNEGPDTNFSGFNFWLDKLNSFNGDFRRAEMVKAFISSDEYRRRFGAS